ncbi:MAG: HAMP domain-containing protein [Candidatus Scalindua sp. AMX11]|nr:MAG: HAMP domain-containing protein [Candidatus Scalindua sp.]NOG83244.1 PAS domain S-box protein [Planctomycetota bacterium]RZV77600.1 MAG: HAMP domain-containing protein [Candidatus Scalindua sp. SCAELEC01]TDE63504.1 MAG: HAMP domain-containing protein [Candidatus Scalindua sp. AMX11]GJQ58674.1 MAG: hypothetical protein SCALA701_14750 [Candidatus Scalindua sp.]
MKLHFKYSLTFTILILSIIFILSGVLASQFRTSMLEMSRTSAETMENKLLEQFEERGGILTRNLVENIINPLYKYDMETMYEITKAVKKQKDIKYIYVYDRKGKIIHDGTKTISFFNSELSDGIRKLSVKSQKFLIQHLEDDILDISSPVMLSDERIGWVKIGLTLKRMKNDIRNMSGQLNTIHNKMVQHNFYTILFTSLGLSFLGIALAGFIGRNLSRPLIKLNSALEMVTKGDLTNIVKVKSSDEIGSLANSFNKMTRDLQQTTVSRNDLLKEIEMRKNTEKRVKSLANILEESLNEIYIFDAKTLKLILVNKGARLNLGYSMEEICNLTPLDLKPEFTAQSFAKMVEPLYEDDKKKIRFETVHRRKDGSLYNVEVYLQNSTFQSIPVFVAIILDITERKKGEKELLKVQKLESLSILAGGIAHDFNNILAGILGMVTLSRISINKENKAYINLKDAETAILNARNLTQQLLVSGGVKML